MAVSATARADEKLRVSVRLEEGRYYSRRALVEECQRQLGIRLSRDTSSPDRCELLAADRLALLAAEQAGLLKVRIGRDRLTIEFSSEVKANNTVRKLFGKLLDPPPVTWPEGTGLQLPEKFDPKRRTALLIHGLESNSRDMQPLARACRRLGWQVLMFEYPNDGPLADSGRRLSSDLKSLTKKHPTLRLFMIAHSMGGLVGRFCLEAPGCNPGCVTDLVCLGTPHGGSVLARGQEWLELIHEELRRGREARWTTLTDGRGEAAIDLLPGSSFLKALDSYGRSDKVRYHVAVGTKGLLDADEQRRIVAEVKATLQRRRVPADKRRAICDFLASPALVKGRGDGAVTVDSASLSGAQTTRRFSLSHTGLYQPSGDAPERHEVMRWIVSVLSDQKRK